MAYRPPFSYIDNYDTFEVGVFSEYIKTESAAIICLVLTHVERTDIIRSVFEAIEEEKVAEIVIRMLNISEASKKTVMIVNKTIKAQMNIRLKDAYRLDTLDNHRKVLESVSTMNKESLKLILDKLESTNVELFTEIVQGVEKYHPEKLV